MELVADLTLVLLAALAGGFGAQRLGQPLIVGYILAGVVVGPFTAGPTVGNVHTIEQLAELGVVLRTDAYPSEVVDGTLTEPWVGEALAYLAHAECLKHALLNGWVEADVDPIGPDNR